MDEQTELLRKILDVLTVMAEPQIAQRDEKLRNALKSIVGRGQKAVKAASLMDGARTQAAICKESGIDGGALSRMTKSLRDAGLLAANVKEPKITIPLSAQFWEELGS